MNGNRSLPGPAVVIACQKTEFLLVLQEKQPKPLCVPVRPDGEVGAYAIFIIENQCFRTPSPSLVGASLHHDVVIADVARAVIAPLRDDEHITIGRLDD